MGQFCYCSLSPQGDDNLSDHYGSYKIYIAAYPRKGTITMGPGQRRCGHQIAAYPRKGTITPRCSPGGWSAEYCSLSPQGDDNPKFYTSFLTTNNCSLSPQGDDNEQVLSVRRKSSHCSLSPQGDDNREGAKNSASKKMRSFSFANLNSLFSVGCPSMNGTIAAAVIFSLLRLLHSDKMCYNKANSKHLLQN